MIVRHDVFGRASRILEINCLKTTRRELVVRVLIIAQLVYKLRSVFIDLAEIGVELQVVLALVENDWLGRVKAEHVSLADVETIGVHDLRGVSDGTRDCWSLVRGSLTMTRVISIG